MIINNDNFLVKEIPQFHPISQKYERLEFWKKEKRSQIEGFWSSGKWMPPELYYYINYHTIIFEEGITKSLGQPFLRDIDWEQALLYTEACGFSGFEFDTANTCHRFYGPEKNKAIKYGFITEEEVNSKRYIDSREYLRRIHGKNLGKALYENEAKNILELASRGYGKALSINTLVKLYEGGNKYLKDINIGDFIIGDDGEKTLVTGTYNQGVRPTYKFTFGDGRTVDADEEHLWGVFVDKKRYKVLTTKQILDKGLKYPSGKAFRFAIPDISPVSYEKRNLLIPPYVVGALIGDGNITGHALRIATDDQEILDKCLKEMGEGYRFHKDTTSNNYHLSYNLDWENPLKRSLNYIGLKGNCSEKIIPNDYMYSSIDQRYELLRGLMDTDGSINTEGSLEYTTINKVLSDQVASLCRSLGIRCQIGIDDRIGRQHILPQGTKYTTKNLIYRVFIRTDKPVFNLKRKLNRLKKRNTRDLVSIINIEKIEDQYCKCVTIDNKSKLFLVEDYIPTHNSYGASGRIAHNFLFDGARDYDMYLAKRAAKKPYSSETVVGAIDAKYSGDLLEKVKVGFDNLPGAMDLDGNGEMEHYPSPLMVGFTGSVAPGRHYTSSVSNSKLHHRTFADNPFAANGTRPDKVFIDEVGFMDNLLESFGAIENTQAAAEFKRLVIYGMGTGGLTKGGAAMYAHEMFYNPEQYNCLVFDDEWENKGKICYFVPATKALNLFKEGPNRISNEPKALEYVLEEREEAKKATSRTKLQATIINKPIKPSEIFLRLEGNFFPTADLTARSADLEANKTILNSTYKVRLNLKEGIPTIASSDKKPIREFPLRKGMDMDACIEIFEQPKKNYLGKIPNGRYIAGWDPIDNDGNDDITRSLQSILIFDLWTDRIVAEYTARTYLAEHFYEQGRRLIMYYSAICLYENKNKGLYPHFKNKNSLYLLAETPQSLKDKNIVKGGSTGNTTLGVATNDFVKVHGFRLILEWLEKQAIDRDKGVRNLDTIESLALLKELIAHNGDINVDRIMALVMVMLLREDRQVITDTILNKKVETKASDPFFDKAFKKKTQQLNFRKDESGFLIN